MRLFLNLLVTVLVFVPAVYGIASIWHPFPIAESIPWLWCILLIVSNLLLSLAIVLAVATVFAWIWCKWGRAGFREGTKCAKLCLNPPPKDPYPNTKCAKGKISNFEYKSDLKLKRFARGLKGVARKDQYIVAAPYTVSFKLCKQKHCITVPKGMLTDLSSAPFPFNCVVGRVGPHLEATIVHDYLYVAWQDHPDCVASEANRRFADKLMLEGMKASGMRCMAHLIYWATRMGGWGAFYGKDPIRYVDLDRCKCGNDEECRGHEDKSCDDCEAPSDKGSRDK